MTEGAALPDSATHVVRNLRDQPVEIHLVDDVLVVPPHGEVPVILGEAPEPQLVELERRLMIDVRPAAESPEPRRRRRASKDNGDGPDAPPRGRGRRRTADREGG